MTSTLPFLPFSKPTIDEATIAAVGAGLCQRSGHVGEPATHGIVGRGVHMAIEPVRGAREIRIGGRPL